MLTKVKTMEKYKYNIGDKVTYSKSIVEEQVCPTCGNEERNYRYEPTEAEVVERKYELVYNVANRFTLLRWKTKFASKQ